MFNLWFLFLHMFKNPGLTHKECVLECLFLGTLTDVTVVFEMRQSIAIIPVPQNAEFGYRVILNTPCFCLLNASGNHV